MDEKKILKLNIKQQENEITAKNTEKQSFLHTNPILSKMFVSNLLNTKKKFSIKDLFR